MQILQVHTRYRQRGGEDGVVENERRILEAAGHSVEVWSPENPESAASAARSLAMAPWNPVRHAEMKRLVEERRPDVVHVHNTWFEASPSVIAGAATVAPVVMTLHNYRLVCANGELLRDEAPCEVCVGQGPWSAVRYGCFRGSRAASAFSAGTIAFNRRRGTWSDSVSRFAALTEFARGRLVSGGLPAEKVGVLPNFVPDPGRRPRSPSESDVVLFVGRLTAAKGVRTLFDAWEQLDRSPFRLRVVGSGPLEDDLAARELPGVEMLGWRSVDEVRVEMASARALVFPSEWYEGMPMTLLEAFASGLPVIGSRIGSVAEIVGGLGGRWLVEPGDASGWASAIRGLVDSAEVDSAGDHARRLFEETHTESAGLARLESLYRSVASV
jgi:glycosyltransferase involved in cell wall biosynthesis